MHFTPQCAALRYPMRKTLAALTIAILATGFACKKKITASEAVKADLKNYLTVEMPKHDELLKLLGSVSENYRETDSDKKGPREKSENENDLLSEGIGSLKQTKIATEDLKRVHAELLQGVDKIQASFVKITLLEKQSGAAASLAGTFSAIQDIIQGIKLMNDWNTDLEAGCKANGLTAEFNAFQAKYGLKAK